VICSQAKAVEGKEGEGEGDGEAENQLAFERKDVWDVKWAEDNPDSLAVMEKTKLFIYTYADPTSVRRNSVVFRPLRILDCPILLEYCWCTTAAIGVCGAALDCVLASVQASDATAAAAAGGLLAQPQAEGEAVQSSGYLGLYKDMEVRTLLLDEVRP
jgi:hypothetical protein